MDSALVELEEASCPVVAMTIVEVEPESSVDIEVESSVEASVDVDVGLPVEVEFPVEVDVPSKKEVAMIAGAVVDEDP